MNYSLITADRTTHLKIVVLSLVAAIAVVVVGFSSRLTENEAPLRGEPGLTANSAKPVAYSSVQAIIR